jgi:hypothetical protein
MRRATVTCAAAAAFVGLLVGSGGCEAIVGGDLPSVLTCVAVDPDPCPQGQACINGVCSSCDNGGCTPITDAGAEDSTVAPEADTSSVPEASEEAPPPTDTGPRLFPLGSGCTASSQCRSNLCADATALTSPVIQASGQNAVCTTACCTSKDCDDAETPGMVCYDTGLGGSYCVKPAWIGVGAVGTKTPGTACGAGTECRSGVCTSSKCEDTCCHDSDCGNGTVCNLEKLGTGAQHRTFVCTTNSPTLDFPCVPTNGAPGDTCGADSDCLSNLCDDYGFTCGRCDESCCKSSDCMMVSSGGTNYPTFCDYEQDPTTFDVYRACVTRTPPTGALGLGASCVVDGGAQDAVCASNYCDPITKQCSQVCCTDSDCQAGAVNWICRPHGLTVMTGTVTVLYCQPP